MSERPAYLRVFLTFARNSLIRDMTFRANFIIDTVSTLGWMAMNLGFYDLIFRYTDEIGKNTGWHEYQFYIFLATTLFINSIIQTFFLPNASEFSELVRTGNLDFALLKPIDTQFLISLQKVEWSGLVNFVFAIFLLIFSLVRLDKAPTLLQLGLYPFYVACGVAILYSLMIVMSSLSVWLGRNQNLYDFWFYITNFSRYPMEIYSGRFGTPLKWAFTFVIPILIVVNVPARIMAQPFRLSSPEGWFLPIVALVATAGSLFLSRMMFLQALRSYRSASS